MIRQRRHLECDSLRHAEPIKTDERIGDSAVGGSTIDCSATVNGQNGRRLLFRRQWGDASGRVAECSDERVCLHVCPSARISQKRHVQTVVLGFVWSSLLSGGTSWWSYIQRQQSAHLGRSLLCTVALFTIVPASPSGIIWCQSKGGDALRLGR